MARRHAQGRRLSAPAGPQQGHDFPIMDVEGKVFHRRLIVAGIGLPQPPEPHRQFGPAARPLLGGHGPRVGRFGGQRTFGHGVSGFDEIYMHAIL